MFSLLSYFVGGFRFQEFLLVPIPLVLSGDGYCIRVEL